MATAEGAAMDWMDALLPPHLASLKACSRAGDVERAEELLELLRGEGPPSVEAYNFLIHACATRKDPDRAELFLREMEAAGVAPTPITYNSVINACAASGDAGRAQGWLLHMVDQGIQPTQVTYGTLCKVFARRGLVSQVRSFMDMLESGGGQLNEYFFASLISACGAAEPPDPRGAARAFNDLVSRGLRPQSVKRALERAVGIRQSAQMFASLGKSSPAKEIAEAVVSRRRGRRERPAAATPTKAPEPRAPRPKPAATASSLEPRRQARDPPSAAKGRAPAAPVFEAWKVGPHACGYVPGAHFLACAAYPLGAMPRLAEFA